MCMCVCLQEDEACRQRAVAFLRLVQRELIEAGRPEVFDQFQRVLTLFNVGECVADCAAVCLVSWRSRVLRSRCL